MVTVLGLQRFWSGKNSCFIISEQIALPIFLLRYVSHGAGSAQGRPVAAAPVPRLWPPKSPLRGTFDLSLQASGRAEAASVQNTALSPHPCGLPRPSGNVSAILRPPTPAVSASAVKTLKAGRKNYRSGKALAATRQKTPRVARVRRSRYPGNGQDYSIPLLRR